MGELENKIDEINRKQLDIITSTTSQELENINTELKGVDESAISTGKSLKTLLGEIGINMGTREAINMLKRSINEVIEAVEDYNTYKTNLRIITGQPDSVVNDMLSGYSEDSIKLGVDISEYQRAAETILRTGKNAADTNMILKDSITLAKTGFIDSEKAASNLITIANAYNMEADSIQNVVDKLLSLDVASQTEGGALSTAVARAAKNAQLAGVTIDSLAAQIANLRDVTGKEEEQIATSLNSIYSRMYNVKLNKFIIEDESGVEDLTEDISDMERILNRVEIKLRDSKSTFRDFDDIIKDLHDNWSKFNEVEKSAIGKTIGGTYHRNVALAMIQDYEDFQKLQDISLNSAGTAAERYEAYTDSIAAKSAELNTALKQMWAHTISDDFVTNIKGATTEVVQFIDKYEILQNLLKTAIIYAAAKGFIYLGGTVAEAYKSVANLSSAFNALSIMKNNPAGTIAYQNALSSLTASTKTLSESQLKLIFSTKQLSEAQMLEILQAKGLTRQEASAALATMGLVTAENTATAATFTLSGAFRALTATIAANPIGAIAIAIMSVLSVISTIKNHSKAAKEAEEALQAQTEASISSYNNEANALADLKKRYMELYSSTKDIATVKGELSSIQDELNEKYDAEAYKIDVVNGKLSEEIEKWQKLELSRAEAFVYDAENVEAYNRALKELSNAGNINGSVDVNIENKIGKEGFSTDVIKAWKDSGLVSGVLKYSMSSCDYGLEITNGEDLETLYKSLDELAEIYKDVSKRSNDFNEAQYNAIKQQSQALKQEFESANAIKTAYENQKAIVESLESAPEEIKNKMGELIDQAAELNRELQGEDNAVEKYYITQQLKDLEAEMYQLAGANTSLQETVEMTFSAFNTGSQLATHSVEGLHEAWFESLDDMQKDTLKNIDSMKSALQSLAEGEYLSHEDFWAIMELDTDRVLTDLEAIGDKYRIGEEQLIQFKDSYINKEIERIELQNEAHKENLRQLGEEHTLYLKNLKEEMEAWKRSGINSSGDERIYKAKIAEITTQIKENEKAQKQYNYEIRNSNLLIDQLKSGLGDTVKMSLELAQNYADNLQKAQEYQIDQYIKAHEREQEVLEQEKQALQDQLDILEEQKSSIEELIKNYESVLSTVQNVIDKEKQAIEDSYNERIDKLKAENEERENSIKLAELLANKENAANNKRRVLDETRGWRYETVAEDVIKADNDLASYENEQAIKALEDERDSVIKSLEEYRDLWKSVSEDITNEENELLAEQILGADWRQKIQEQDIAILEQFRSEYRDHNTDLKNLTNSEIALVKAAIEAKEKEIKAKQEQIASWKKFKTEVQDAVNDIKNKNEEYMKLIDKVKLNENSNLEEREANLRSFVTEYQGCIDKVKSLQAQLSDVQVGLYIDTNINQVSDEMANFIDAYRDAIEAMQRRLEESSTGYGVVNSPWDAKLAEAARALRGYSIGGTADFTGLAMLHGTKQRSETIFNATDSAKLYDLVHSTPNLIADIMSKATQLHNANYTNTKSNTQNTANNVTFHIDKIVTDNPVDFEKQLDRYYRTKLTESYTK